MLFVCNAKPIKIKSLTWGIVPILLGSLASCGTPEISIEEISQQKSGKVIQIQGEVTRSAPFINNSAYQLKDGTGTVWVVTQQQPPQLDRLAIEGEVRYQSLPLAQQEFGDFYIVELERLDPVKNNE